MVPLQVPAATARKVFILGAGASTADGAPLQAGLFRRYAEIVARNPHGAHAEREGQLRTFFASFWGADIDSPNLATESFPTFEEALGLLQLAEVRGEFFKEFGALPHEGTRAKQIEQHLVETIAQVLDDALRGPSRVHATFVQSLERLTWLDSSDFVSLNYDLLADNALSNAGRAIEYGVRFRGVSAPPRATRLLKPHGSLNWLFCPTCNELDLYPGEKIVADILNGPHLVPCAVCLQPRRPILVPPTFFKAMSNYYLQQIWKSAEEVFFEAQHLIFCGYSFPDADIHFKYLLKRAEMNHSDPARRLEVFIVNEHPGKKDGARDAELERFIRFFRDKGLVRWTNLSFADLARDPVRYADPALWRPA